MGIDTGFDMVPRLSSGIVDKYNWSRFIALITDHYGNDENVELKPNYILFKVGEHPMLPFEGQKLLRFSSKTSGSCSSAAPYINKITRLAKIHFGSRVYNWDEAFDQHGHYDWNEVHESQRSYEQRDELEAPTSISEYISGTNILSEVAIPLFEVKDIPGKGKGLVARFNIPRGTRIIQEKPLMVSPAMATDDLEACLAPKLRRLSKTEQRQFLSLHNNFRGKHPFSGIFRTNALPCGSGSTMGGVYPTICLINHNCLPNSQHTWNSDVEHETVHAIRPLACGEEITICYDRGGSSATRKAFLHNGFGFSCSCDICSLPPGKLRESDNRRGLIERLDDQIGNPFRMSSSPKDSLSDCQSLLSTLEAEYNGYPGVLTARLYYDAFQICIAHGDQARASIFAERAYKVRIICEGEDSPETKRAKALAAQPSNHRSFELCSSKWRQKRETIPKGLGKEAFEKWLFRERGS